MPLHTLCLGRFRRNSAFAACLRSEVRTWADGVFRSIALVGRSVGRSEGSLRAVPPMDVNVERKYLGVLLALIGNLLISLGLNAQKYAHRVTPRSLEAYVWHCTNVCESTQFGHFAHRPTRVPAVGSTVNAGSGKLQKQCAQTVLGA